MWHSLARSPAALLTLVTLLLLSCAGPANQGMPSTPGQYEVRSQSIQFDGKTYGFDWVKADQSIQHARAQDLKLVQDERTFLEVPGPGQGPPVLHVTAEEPVAVRHSSGGYHSSWFPFLIPLPMGGYGPAPAGAGAGYHYPPTDKFGRGDTLHGSEQTARAGAPDYSKVRPAPNAVSGQNSGTGDGTSATNRAGSAISGQSGGTGSGSAATDRGTGAISGQAGGVGSGSAASDKATVPGTGAGSAATNRGGQGGVSAAPAPAAGSQPSAGSSGSSSRPRGGAVGGGRRR